MNCNAVTWNHIAGHRFRELQPAMGFLILLILCSATAFAQNASQPANSPINIRATHVLGFAGAKNNASGSLSIQADSLQFEKSGKPPVQVQIASVQDVFLGQQSKQVGGLPMTLSKAAAPYGGGRVVSLFAHKKYDTLTLEYVDNDGGLHGAMFQLAKGQGEVLRNALVAKGAHVGDVESQPKPKGTVEVSNESK